MEDCIVGRTIKNCHLSKMKILLGRPNRIIYLFMYRRGWINVTVWEAKNRLNQIKETVEFTNSQTLNPKAQCFLAWKKKKRKMEQGTLLDEALGSLHLSGRVVLLEDCVETSAAFVLHHILKRSLSQPPHSSNVVVFVAFAHPFSHYDRILRRLVLPLSSQRISLF